MSSHDLVALMKDFVLQVQQEGKLERVKDFVADDFVNHSDSASPDPGPVQLQKLMSHLHATVSNIKVEILSCVSDGTTVATHKIFRGTQHGEFFGKPATGKAIEMDVMDFIIVRDGKFREHWSNIGGIVDK